MTKPAPKKSGGPELAKLECVKCHVPVTQDDYCSECYSYICFNCDETKGVPIGYHTVEQHFTKRG